MILEQFYESLQVAFELHSTVLHTDCKFNAGVNCIETDILQLACKYNAANLHRIRCQNTQIFVVTKQSFASIYGDLFASRATYLYLNLQANTEACKQAYIWHSNLNWHYQKRLTLKSILRKATNSTIQCRRAIKRRLRYL